MKLWEPSASRIEEANITAFIRTIEKKYSLLLKSYHSLYEWSVTQPELFWEEVWKFCDIKTSKPYTTVLENRDLMPGASWFAGTELNFAENLLRYRDDKEAIVFWGEDKLKRKLTYDQLYETTERLVRALKTAGVTKGDRVAGYLPNLPEAIIAMLATTSLGAIWSSSSPDFGVDGVVDRFGQIKPKILFAANGYYYKGKPFDCLAKLDQIKERIPSIEKLILVSYTKDSLDAKAAKNVIPFNDFLSPPAKDPDASIQFEQVPFNHPLYIMFSSGTTGKPKCIVHGSGGTLLEHLKEHKLHTDLTREDRLFYATTCGWMMWNWLTSGLASGATILLYDGFPLHNDGKILFDYAEREKITVFGTSAGYISAIKKAGLKPVESHDLTSLKTILSTGSPLTNESYDYVYQEIKSDLCLASISGGTDIIGCFALGCPIIPVYRGELQCRSLGYAVEVWDDQGQSLRGERGNLVCKSPFPSMPIYFWNDPDQEIYHNAYFADYPNVWNHGDFVELTKNNGMIFYGRSDAVLNPGGVRIGTAEIYRQVEQIPEVLDSVVVGQKWMDDIRVVLFVKLKPDTELTGKLIKKIAKQIREKTTPRHVPKKIIKVADIPVTRSGKISELAVKNIVNGNPVSNAQALANPEALELFKNLKELAE